MSSFDFQKKLDDLGKRIRGIRDRVTMKRTTKGEGGIPSTPVWWDMDGSKRLLTGSCHPSPIEPESRVNTGWWSKTVKSVPHPQVVSEGLGIAPSIWRGRSLPPVDVQEIMKSVPHPQVVSEGLGIAPSIWRGRSLPPVDVPEIMKSVPGHPLYSHGDGLNGSLKTMMLDYDPEDGWKPSGDGKTDFRIIKSYGTANDSVEYRQHVEKKKNPWKANVDDMLKFYLNDGTKGDGLKKPRAETKWTRHLSEFKKSHSGLSLKECMQQAKLTYQK